MDDKSHTFLFADLVGFTALAELEGDDRALEVALALQRRVRELLAPHHAEQVKGTGDGMMLRCTEPQAAIKLGLRLVEDLAEVEGFPPIGFLSLSARTPNALVTHSSSRRPRPPLSSRSQHDRLLRGRSRGDTPPSPHDGGARRPARTRLALHLRAV